MNWFGLGKKRSKLGKWLDQREIDQLKIEQQSGLSRGTISKACNDNEYIPKYETAQRILKAIKKLTGKDVRADQFWDM